MRWRAARGLRSSFPKRSGHGRAAMPDTPHNRPAGMSESKTRKRGDRPRRTAAMNRERHIFVHGFRAIEELISAQAPGSVLMLARAGARGRKLAALAAVSGVPVRRVSEEELSRHADPSRHRGALLRVRDRRPRSGDRRLAEIAARIDGGALFVAVDGVTDAANLGAILRSAEGFGVDVVILHADRAAPVTPTAIRTAAGATAYLQIVTVTNFGSRARATAAVRILGGRRRSRRPAAARVPVRRTQCGGRRVGRVRDSPGRARALRRPGDGRDRRPRRIAQRRGGSRHCLVPRGAVPSVRRTCSVRPQRAGCGVTPRPQPLTWKNRWLLANTAAANCSAGRPRRSATKRAVSAK